jgi:pyruvate formate lyase activating enzyme
LRYVYEGNAPGEGGENTLCPNCSYVLIKRFGYSIESDMISNGTCPDCGAIIAGINM